MNSVNRLKEYITSRISANLMRAGLLLSALFVSSFSYAAEPVCAVVKIEIQQELTLERQAFDARMKINNGLDLLPLENVNINVSFKDETGASVLATSDTNNLDAKFFIKVDSMQGISDISGLGTVAPKSSAEVHWLIIPAPGAGGTNPNGKLYFVGASLDYTLGGEPQNTTVTPDSIYVKPLPLLQLDYFLERDVFADDAFTPEIEPAIPFTLGVRVKNNGAATANNLAIDSGQPTIVENVQGLLVGFNIIGSHVNDAPSTNSLNINFGDIAPNAATMGRWDMVTTLSGRFTEFTADFSHADDLGGRLTSLIDPDGITTHTLVRNVRVDVAGRDNVRDFLANDDGVYRVYESSGVDTDVTDVSGSANLAIVNNGTEATLSLTTPVTSGFSYVKLPDPFAGTKVIKQMVRSDGKPISLDNAWTSKTRNLNTTPPSWDYFVNFFDANSTGTYTLLMGAADIGPVAPEFTPLNNITTYETASIAFSVSATDANGDAVTLTSSTLPAGASFTSDTSGSGNFNWSPAVGQAGNYTISFTASDGTLSTQASVNIKVNPAWDTDGDGMDDAWEIQMFGDLNRDGTGDLDGDGISDLQEYLDKTDPTLQPPLKPINLVALPGNAENTLSWDTATGADSYNIYWSLEPGVTPANGTLEVATSSPHTHTGLDSDVTYYYIVTSVGVGGESDASNEVSVRTGIRDWTADSAIDANIGGTSLNPRVAVSPTGAAIAVWQQDVNGVSVIFSNHYDPLNKWGTPAPISDPLNSAINPQVGMDGNGNAMVSWQQDNGNGYDIMALRHDGLGWLTPEIVDADTASAINPELVMSRNGNAMLVWQQGSSLVYNQFDGVNWASATLLSTESTTIENLVLSVNENGDAFAAWASSLDQTSYDLRLARFTASTSSWSTSTVATGLDNSLIPAIDMNDSGAAMLAWPQHNGTRHVLMASIYDVSTGWSVAQAVENNIGTARTPQVALDVNGNGFVAWAQSGSPFSIYANRYDANTGFQGVTLIEARERGDASIPQLAMDNSGNAVVTWQQSDGVSQNILAATYNNTDATWKPATVIETQNEGNATSPSLAMNETGNALVVFQQATVINNGDNSNTLTNIASNHYEVGNNGVPNIAPIAVAGNDLDVNEQTAVSLDGSGSFDQDGTGNGTVVSYNWVQTAGTTLTLTGADTATPSFTVPEVLATDGVQSLSFELTVTDDANSTATATVNVTVNPVNAIPTANAGTDISANEQSLVNLDGSGTDIDGTVESYSWKQVSGETVTLDTTDPVKPSFTAPNVLLQDGSKVLVFELTVTDNEGASSSSTTASQVSVTINPVNAAPTVNAGNDKTVDEQTAVDLTAVANDADGAIASIEWTQVSGASVQLVNANTDTVSFTAPGVLVQHGPLSLTFRVTVIDNEGVSSSDDVIITVNAVNATPTISVEADKQADEQTTVTLNGQALDADGSIASYQWTQTAGDLLTLVNANTAQLSFVAPEVLVQNGPKTFSFTLKATDNEGAEVTSKIVTVTVNAVNATPTISVEADKQVDEQTNVTLSGQAQDSDGTIASYQWTQTAGDLVTMVNANTAQMSFVAPEVLVQNGPKTFSFSLKATDNEGAEITSNVVTVTVNAVNATPTISVDADKQADEQTTVTLNGQATDSDGTIASYQWTQTSGDLLTLVNANTAQMSFVAPEVLVQNGPKTFSFTLKATDNEGAEITSNAVTVTVNAVNATPTISVEADKQADEQTTVTLNGQATDSDGTIAAYQWTQTAGDPLTLVNANTAELSFVAPEVLVQNGPKSFSFTLKATDNEGAEITSNAVTVTVNAVNATPTISVDADKQADEQTTVTLNGQATDSDGTIAAYQWTQTAGDPLTLVNANTAQMSFVAPEVLVQNGPKTFSFTLKATDNEGAEIISNPVTVTVNAVNATPTISVEADKQADEQTIVTLKGQALDTDGTIVSYQWTQTAGDLVTLNNSNTDEMSFVAPEVLVQNGPKTFSFTLKATDNEGADITSSVVTVTVNAVNANPVANAGADQAGVIEQTTVTLTGNGTDSDGEITTYGWKQLSGLPVTLTVTNHVATFTAPEVLVQDGPQQLVFELTVTDNEGASVADVMTVTVNAVNATPTISVDADKQADEQTTVTLKGLALDTDGTIASYQWTQTAGDQLTLVNANTAELNFVAPVVLVQNGPKTFSFTLTATDNEGAEVISNPVTVIVNAVNLNPVADAGEHRVVYEQTPVTLNGTASQDNDGSIATYHWEQLSGPEVVIDNVASATPGFTSPVVLVADSPTVLTFRLTVTDNEGASTSSEVSIGVMAVNENPIANAGNDQYVPEYSTVNLTGSGTDSDGEIAGYEWNQTAGIPVALTGTNQAAASFVAPAVYQDEALIFELVVTDNEGGVSLADSVVVTLYSVNPDDDADGLPDLYEIESFGNLDRDGTGDFDNDGYSDLDEYQQGTNPLAITLAAPTGVKAVASDSRVKLSWNNVENAVGYNLYWDTTPNVTRNSHVISNVSSGYEHTGLVNGTTYYYAVTTLSDADESVVSDIVNATPGQRTWKSAQRVDDGTITYYYPQIAMNRHGDGVVVFEQHDGTAYSAFANMYHKDSGWGTAQAIETGNNGNVYNPQVAIDDMGNAVAVWEQFNGSSYNVWANVYDAQNASWGVAEQVETSLTGGNEFYHAQVAMSANGKAMVVWQKYDGLAISTWSSRFDMHTGWTQAEKVETSDNYYAYLPQVDMDKQGNAVVAWEQYDASSGKYSTWARHYSVASGWGTISVLSNLDNHSAYDVQVALSESGRTVATWEQFDGTRFNVWSNIAENGNWGTAQRVEYNTTGANEYYLPQVAIDNAGNAIAVWQQFDGQQLSAWANRYSNGGWGTAQRIEVNGLTAITNPRIAMDEDGNAMAAWEQYDSSDKQSLISIWANRYRVGTGWSEARPVETSDVETMWYPEVAMDAYGNANVVWWNAAETEYNILVAANVLATHPPVANAGVDQTGIQSRDTVLLDASASTDANGTIASYHWHQLDGLEVELVNKNSAVASFVAPRTRTTETLTFIVTVTDNHGNSASDKVAVTVGDTASLTTSSASSSSASDPEKASVDVHEQAGIQQNNLNSLKGREKYSSKLKSMRVERRGFSLQTYNNRFDEYQYDPTGRNGRGAPVKARKSEKSK